MLHISDLQRVIHSSRNVVAYLKKWEITRCIAELPDKRTQMSVYIQKRLPPYSVSSVKTISSSRNLPATSYGCDRESLRVKFRKDTP
jgi:hypothetical protein